MAVISEMPSLGIISGFRKTIDFCYFMGIPYARKCPVRKKAVTSPLELANNAIFSAAARLWNELSPEVRAAYASMTGKSDISGRDVFTRSYITNLYRTPPP